MRDTKQAMHDSSVTPTAAARQAPARPKLDPQSRPKRQPPYSVILGNDNEHSFPYVIETLQRVFGYGWFKALRLTVSAHRHGRAAVWAGPLETCEFKRDRMRSMGPDRYARKPVNFPLDVRLEPLPQ
jgi:ATP-dependent Clp protease adaptor protein ClpS